MGAFVGFGSTVQIDPGQEVVLHLNSNNILLSVLLIVFFFHSNNLKSYVYLIKVSKPTTGQQLEVKSPPHALPHVVWCELQLTSPPSLFPFSPLTMRASRSSWTPTWRTTFQRNCVSICSPPSRARRGAALRTSLRRDPAYRVRWCLCSCKVRPLETSLILCPYCVCVHF